MSQIQISYLFAALVIWTLPFLDEGCFIFYSPYCDPSSDQYDEDICRATRTIETFNEWLLGNPPEQPIRTSGCRPLFKCTAPYCKRVDENGSFEASFFGQDVYGWTGDRNRSLSISPSSTEPLQCLGGNVLKFDATSPVGPSVDFNATVFQLVDINSLIPELARPSIRRARAQAFFYKEQFNNQFELQIDAYSGNPALFPTSGNPDEYATNTADYARLDSQSNTLIYDDQKPEQWQGISTSLSLPEGTDFLVVLLRAVENQSNNVIDPEFLQHFVDNVRIGLDKGNARILAVDDDAATNEDEPVDVSVISNDFDAEDAIDRESLAIASAPIFGTAQVTRTGIITYSPFQNTNGEDLFSYVVADDEGIFSNEALVRISVTPVNDPPTAFDNTYQRQGTNPITVVAPGVLENDTDIEDDDLTAVLTGDVGNGTLVLNPDGSFTYTPDPGFLGADSFTYIANDGTDDSDDASVTIEQFTLPNQPPTAENEQIESSLNTPVIIQVLINDFDPDGTLDPGSLTVTTGPAHGTADVLPDGTIRYTPTNGYTGLDQFKYTVNDDDGATSNEAVVDIEIF